MKQEISKNIIDNFQRNNDELKDKKLEIETLNLHSHNKPEWLFCLTFESGEINENTLILHKVSNCLEFTDRPFRQVKTISTSDIQELWSAIDENDKLSLKDDEEIIEVLEDSFLLNPPNAALYSNDQIGIVSLKKCVQEKDNLFFEFDYLSNSNILKKNLHNGALFIDMKVTFSWKSIAKRDLNTKIVKKNGRVYVIEKSK